MTKDPEKGEGLDQLFDKGKALETERDVALRKDPYFDWSQALLQIAIVLASVHLIIGNLMLLGLSGGLAALGVLLMMNGYTLAMSLPRLGWEHARVGAVSLALTLCGKKRAVRRGRRTARLCAGG